ncbi:MAG: 5'-deoxynucleotidase [Oscillospiraceae bacterium]
MQSSFFSMILRMKYIDRWGLMRSTHNESLSEHTLDVAILAHALAVIATVRLGKNINAERVAMLAIYHDASEIITGDMPTPVKYHDEAIIKAYKQVEKAANENLFSMLPSDIAAEYQDYFKKNEDDKELWKLVKAADKLSALIKCVEEEKSGNTEFMKAKQSILEHIHSLDMKEVKVFMQEFFEPFTKTLDEQ